MGLDGVELVMDLEKEFNASADRVRLTTVGALYEWMRAQVAPDLPAGRCAGELWERYLDVVERSTGMPARASPPRGSVSRPRPELGPGVAPRSPNVRWNCQAIFGRGFAAMVIGRLQLNLMR